MHTKTRSALIIGAGIVGLACAWRLQRQGLATTIISPGGSTRAASWGNAGHIAVEQVEPLASAKSVRKALRLLLGGGGAISAPLGDIRAWGPFFARMVRASGNPQFQAGTAALAACMQRAMPAWRALLAEIEQPQLLVEQGHFVVWESPGSAARGRAHWNGISRGPASFRSATADEIERLSALIGKPPADAIRFEGTGQVVDPGVLLESLLAAIVAAGGEHVRGTALTIEPGARGAARVTVEDGKSYTADAIVVAAGVASGRLLQQTGSVVPIIAERGYHIQAPTDAWPEALPPVVFEDRAMIVTNFLSALRASSFVEFARPDRPPTPAKWRTLQRHAAELGLPFKPPVSQWMGARPTLPDYLPAIGKSGNAANLYYAFGHQHLGLTLAAMTAEIIGDLVCERPAPIDVRPFDIERFH